MATQSGSTFLGINIGDKINQVGNINGNVNFSILSIDTKKFMLMDVDGVSSDDERKRFFRWLDFIDFRADQNNILKKRHGQTGGWILERRQFKDWIEGQNPSLLWCWGSPGIGKSVIASTVVQYLEQSQANVSIAYVYFKYDSRESQTPATIVRSLLQQMCCKLDNIPMYILDLYRNFNRNNLLPSVAELITALRRLCDSYHQSFIIIDALDECDKNCQEEVLEFLTELTNTTSRVKIFVTSRREVDIERHFWNTNTPIIPIEARDVGGDIVTFVHDQVDRQFKRNWHRINSEALRKKIITSLVEKSQGMFLWVNLQLERLSKLRREIEIEEALSNLPQDLGETYQRIIKHIDKQEPSLRDLCQRSLIWVFYATRPLAVDELVHAVSVDGDCHSGQDLKRRLWGLGDIIDACSNLLVVENWIVRPIHFSVREYFITAQTKHPETFLSHTSNANFAYNYLVISCLRYLMIDEFKISSPNHYRRMHRIRQFSLLPHASYVFDKYILATVVISQDLARCLGAFLESQLQFASILQVRALKDSDLNSPNHRKNFFRFYRELNCANIIHATSLAGSAQLDCVKNVWKDVQPTASTFFYMLRESSTDALTKLLAMGIGRHVNTRDENNNTALYLASENGNISLCRLLLTYGADVNAHCGDFGNALYIATYNQHPDIVSLLIENGADIKAKGGKRFENPLQIALQNRDKAMVGLLLQTGADRKVQSEIFRDELRNAVYHSHRDMLCYLLEHGSTVHDQSKIIVDALWMAVNQSHGDIVRRLLQEGTYLAASNGLSGKLLHRAIYRGCKYITKLLLENGSDANAECKLHGNSLPLAIYQGHGHMLKLLIKNGAKFNVDATGMGNLLQAVVYHGDVAVVCLLLEEGADVNFDGRFGTPLEAAIQHGHKHIIHLLLSKGAKLKMGAGRLADLLRAAMVYDDTIVVGLLLKDGADIEAKKGFGSLLEAAIQRGYKPVIRLLLENGASPWVSRACRAASATHDTDIIGMLSTAQMYFT